MKRLLFMLLLSFVSVPAAAQTLSQVRPAHWGSFLPNNAKPVPERPWLIVSALTLAQTERPSAVNNHPRWSVPETPPRFWDWKVWGLIGAAVVTMSVDTHVTYKVQEICPLCEESNFYTRPFINAGPKVVYPAIGVAAASLAILDFGMRKHHNPVIRKVWPLAASLIIIGNIFATRDNLELMRQYRK